MKPGLKTTELYVTLVVIVLGLLMSTGVIAEGSQWHTIAGAVLVAAGAVAYPVSRGLAKATIGAKDPAAFLEEALRSLVKTTSEPEPKEPEPKP